MVDLNIAISKHPCKEHKEFIQLVKLMINHSVTMSAIMTIDFKWGTLIQYPL